MSAQGFQCSFWQNTAVSGCPQEKGPIGPPRGRLEEDSHGMLLLAARHASTSSRICLHGCVSRSRTVLCWGCSPHGEQFAAETNKSESANCGHHIFHRVSLQVKIQMLSRRDWHETSRANFIVLRLPKPQGYILLRRERQPTLRDGYVRDRRVRFLAARVVMI